VRAHGQLVLLLAADLPLGGGDRRVVAHRQAGARLGVARHLRHELAGPDAGQRLEPLLHRLRAVDGQEGAAHLLVDRHRGVGRGVDAAGDAGLHLPEGDLVGDQDGGFQAGAARLLDVVGRGARRQPGAQHALPGQVEVPRVLEDGAGHDLADLLALQPEAGDQPVQGRGEHVLVRRPGVPGVRAGEGEAVAADDRGLPGLRCHRGASGTGGPAKTAILAEGRAVEYRRYQVPSVS
jgi:hypothetical protein